MLFTDIFFNIPLAISLHNIGRWLLLVLGLLVIGMSLYAWLNKKPFYKIFEKISFFYSLCVDLMLILGVILWVWGNWGFRLLETIDFKTIMQQKEQRFFFLEHPLLMLVVLILVHIARIGLKNKKISDHKKYRKLFVWNFIAFVLILFSIPWFRI